MSSSSAQFATTRQMGIYEPFRQVPMWKNTYHENDNILFTTAPAIVDVDHATQQDKVNSDE